MRRALLLLAILALVAGLAAHLTRPGEDELSAMISKAVRERVDEADLSAEDDPLRTVVVAACKLSPGDCASLVRDLLDLRIERGLFVTRATVAGLGRQTRCLGVFGRFYCSRPERA